MLNTPALVLQLFLAAEVPANPARVKALTETLQAKGVAPIAYVQSALNEHDLVIFDDAQHSAQEPWVFYQQLVRDPGFHKRAKFVFFETLGTNEQDALDRYVQSSKPDRTLLEHVFQDSYNGTGWPYEATLDLIETVRQVNATLPSTERLRCIGVNPPIYWEAIHTREQYDSFLNSLEESRDYAMYVAIRKYLDGFGSGKKGIFLTNTRHAYQDIHTPTGRVIWNTAAFFHNWDPNKTASVRVHNLALKMTPRAQPKQNTRTAEGLQDFDLAWVQIDDGNWDAAFAANSNKPVGISLSGNLFGSTAFVGTGTRGAAAGLTFGQLYDGTIFLAPTASLHNSARTTFYFTPSFKIELKRRLGILFPKGFDELFAALKCANVDACIEKLGTPEPATLARSK